MPRRRGIVLLAVLVATSAQRGATPTGHALLLGTQRTGTTWAMAELARSPCVSTTSELFIQFKWERGARMACPVPLTVRGTQALVSFAPLAFKLFYAARHNAVLRRSHFPSL